MAHLIAIEGIDGSGKGTQARRLQQTLADEGHRTQLLSFPRYDETHFGRAIGDFLNGRFGALDEVHPQLAALLFAGDRFESRPVLDEALGSCDLVVCDRYIASNIAHQAAKLCDSQRPALIDWIQTIECDVYGLPQPDLTLLLDLPATTAQQLIARKSARTYTDKPADLQEADTAYLESVRGVYRELEAVNEHWCRIDIERGGQLRTVDEIASDIAAAVRHTLLPRA